MASLLLPGSTATGPSLIQATIPPPTHGLQAVSLLLSGTEPTDLVFPLSVAPQTQEMIFLVSMFNFGADAWAELDFALGTMEDDAFVLGGPASFTGLDSGRSSNSNFRALEYAADTSSNVTFSAPFNLIGTGASTTTTLGISITQPANAPYADFTLRVTPGVPEPVAAGLLAGAMLMLRRSPAHKPPRKP